MSNRNITQNENKKLLVNKRPLQFYHFSGFDSGAQATMLAIYGNDNPILFDLREWYIERQNEEGQKIFGISKSKYNFYDNGESINKLERQLLRTRQDLTEHFKNTDPYVTNKKRSYYKWYKTEGYKANSEMTELEKIYHSRSWKIACFISKIYSKWLSIKPI